MQFAIGLIAKLLKVITEVEDPNSYTITLQVPREIVNVNHQRSNVVQKLMRRVYDRIYTRSLWSGQESKRQVPFTTTRNFAEKKGFAFEKGWNPVSANLGVELPECLKRRLC